MYGSETMCLNGTQFHLKPGDDELTGDGTRAFELLEVSELPEGIVQVRKAEQWRTTGTRNEEQYEEWRNNDEMKLLKTKWSDETENDMK